MSVFAYNIAFVGGVVSMSAFLAFNCGAPHNTNFLAVSEEDGIFTHFANKYGKRYGSKGEY